MRNDEVLAWLNNSRVNIVHKSNLETKSRAIVIIKNYLDLATLTIELPSFLPNEAILLQLYTESPIDLKSRQTEHSIITIERRWIEDNLPNWELLEALRHAFMVIKEIIQDAHVQCTMNTCNLIDQLHGKAILSDYYECMDNFRNFRFRTYSTKDGRELTIKTFSQSADPDLGAKAVKRYNISKDNIILHPEANISELAEIYLNHAKKVLIKDKYHIPLVLLRLHDKSWQMLSFQTYKREEKYHIWHEIGDLVEKYGSDALIFISEVWIGNVDEFEKKGIFPDKQKNHREALQVVVAAATGTVLYYTAIFRRTLFGKIIFEDTILEEGGKLYFLAPVLKKWGVTISEED